MKQDLETLKWHTSEMQKHSACSFFLFYHKTSEWFNLNFKVTKLV